MGPFSRNKIEEPQFQSGGDRFECAVRAPNVKRCMCTLDGPKFVELLSHEFHVPDVTSTVILLLGAVYRYHGS